MNTTDSQDQKQVLNKIIQNHVLGAMGVGMIPMPLVDLIALSGVQLNLVRKLAKIYEIPFSKDAAKSAIASLLGGVIPISISGALASIVKAIPIVGQTTSAIVMPAVSGAMTYAVGKVFIQHFESGGTFLNFNPEEVRQYYQQMFEEGKKVASTLAPEAGGESTAEESTVSEPETEKEAQKPPQASESESKPKTKPVRKDKPSSPDSSPD